MKWFDYLGILASVLVLLSYTISNQRKLRLVNIVASVIFVAYGIITACILGGVIGIITASLNGFCILVHIYHLLKDRNQAKIAAENTKLHANEEDSLENKS